MLPEISGRGAGEARGTTAARQSTVIFGRKYFIASNLYINSRFVGGGCVYPQVKVAVGV
jgi:hypothetical protein